MNWGGFLTANADYCIWLDWYLSFWLLDIRVLQLYFLFCTVFSHFITMHTVETLNIFKSLLQTLHSCSKLLVDFQHSFCTAQALWSELPCNYQLTKKLLFAALYSVECDIHIYIYIYMCVCVCVFKTIFALYNTLNGLQIYIYIYIYLLYIYLYIFVIYIEIYIYIFVIFNWNSFHARLNSHYKTWSYKKKKHKNIKAYLKSL